MLLDCKICKNKFTLIEDEINLEGKLITCEYCKEEWIYQSRTHYLEVRLAELDEDLNKKEIKISEENIKHNEKIHLLEKDLKTKKEELTKQKLLEERIGTFEKRITDTEKLNSQQADLEIQVAQMENEVKKTSENILTKNDNIEKKANYLEMKINSYKRENKNKESIVINDRRNDVVNFSG